MSARRGMAEDTPKLGICNIPSKQEILTVQSRYILVHNKAVHRAVKIRQGGIYPARTFICEKPKKWGFGLAMPTPVGSAVTLPAQMGPTCENRLFGHIRLLETFFGATPQPH